MIAVKNNNLFYNTEHLRTSKPKSFDEVLERIDSIECQLFYNIISSPDCRYEKKFAEGRIQEHYKHLSAEERFKNIFAESTMYANPKSYFVNKLNVAPKDCDDIKSVSFTHCDYKDLKSHFDARGSEYGICFFHDFLQNNGIRPVEYLHLNSPDLQKQLVFNSPHLIEVSSAMYDMSWEKEWRIKNNINFTQNDIAFVIVPGDRHSYYVEWFREQDDFQEVQILSSNIFKSPVDHLIQYPQQDDNNWRQIGIFPDQNGNGLKIDADEFNNLTKAERIKFAKLHEGDLNRFAKNTIISAYEFALTTRYLRFTSKISGAGSNPLFNESKLILENRTEPEDAQRDLVKNLFGKLFEFRPPAWLRDPF